ncbi:MAG: AAA family ATPase [Candidatus Woesearchaeota archaeon]
MRLIAIVGMTGSGKSELAKLFEKDNYQKIRFGDITTEIIKQKGLVENEQNEKLIRESIRKEHGMAAYAKLNLPKIEELLKRGNVIIDGLYSWEEYLFLKEKFPYMIVLAIYSPPEMRYERLTEREIRGLTKEQAKARDKAEIENLNKAGPIVMADYTLLNVGTLYDLEINYKKFLEWLNEQEEIEK